MTTRVNNSDVHAVISEYIFGKNLSLSYYALEF